MNQELQKQLFDKYPELFIQKDLLYGTAEVKYFIGKYCDDSVITETAKYTDTFHDTEFDWQLRKIIIHELKNE